MKRWVAIAFMAASTSLLIFLMLEGRKAPKAQRPILAALQQSYISVDPPTPVNLPQLMTTESAVFARERLLGHWSLVFVGFTACPMVCPKTLSILSAAARDVRSGVPSGSTQLIFVSIDPERDDPQHIRTYLDLFDRRIVGLTGSAAALEQFNNEIGAGFKAAGTGFDHSTSVFVLDPEARLAGILLHPGTPASIVADLSTLRSLAEAGSSKRALR